MSEKPLVFRQRALGDIDAAAFYHRGEANERVALAFADAADAAARAIGQRPRSGSPRYAHELQTPGLSFFALKRFPYLLFYIERDDHIDVVRLLQAQADIPNWLEEGAD